METTQKQRFQIEIQLDLKQNQAYESLWFYFGVIICEENSPQACCCLRKKYEDETSSILGQDLAVSKDASVVNSDLNGDWDLDDGGRNLS